MDTNVANKEKRHILKFISTVISWTVFVLLLICAILLLYYFIALRIYSAKGSGHEPPFSLYTIISPSMTPNIQVYDVVVDVKVNKPEDIKINDVITFNSGIPGVGDGTITHRVIAINKDEDGNYQYQTKGDANLLDDGANIPFTSVVGKVAFKIPKLGRVQFFLASKAGWLVCILIPALYIIIKDILKLFKIQKVDENSGKVKKFLNKPLLIGHKRRRLLTYTPKKETFMVDEEDIDTDDLPKLK